MYAVSVLLHSDAMMCTTFRICRGSNKWTDSGSQMQSESSGSRSFQGVKLGL